MGDRGQVVSEVLTERPSPSGGREIERCAGAKFVCLRPLFFLCRSARLLSGEECSWTGLKMSRSGGEHGTHPVVPFKVKAAITHGFMEPYMTQIR